MMLRRLWAATIWHPDAIPPEEWKYRSVKRVWLPVYDVLAIVAGGFLTAVGSPTLYRIFTPSAVTILGLLLVLIGTVCLLGVALPSLWRVEIVGKVLLVVLIGMYAVIVLTYPRDHIPGPGTLFVANLLILSLPLPMFRLGLLGEEIKERRRGER